MRPHSIIIATGLGDRLACQKIYYRGVGIMLQGITLQNWNYAAALELCCNRFFEKSYAAGLELCCNS